MRQPLQILVNRQNQSFARFSGGIVGRINQFHDILVAVAQHDLTAVFTCQTGIVHALQAFQAHAFVVGKADNVRKQVAGGISALGALFKAQGRDFQGFERICFFQRQLGFKLYILAGRITQFFANFVFRQP